MTAPHPSPSRPPLGRESPIPEEMKIGARHLRALAATIDAHIPTDRDLVRPGSPAEAEMADRSFDGPWGRATRQVVHEVATHASYASDHMQGMAAVTTAPAVVFSLSTLSRTVLESLARACWIYEPGLETRERVRRVYNVRLETLREELNILGGLRTDGPRWPDPEQESSSSTRAKILKIKMGAQRAGFTYVSGKPSRRVPALAPARYLDRPVPSTQRLLSEMFRPLTSPDADGRPDLGPIIHRLTSATAHGQAHGMQFFVMGQAKSIRGG